MRSSWENEDDCWSEEREEDPEEKELSKFEDEMEDPDENELDPELDEKEELPEFEELKLDAGFSVILTKFSCTLLVSVYPMGPAS